MTEQGAFGAELRRRRVDFGLSLAALAELVNYSKGHLGKVETGQKTASADLVRRCDAALECAGELIRLAGKPTSARPVAGAPAELWSIRLAPDGRCEFDMIDTALPYPSVAQAQRLAPQSRGHLPDAETMPPFLTAFDAMRRLGQVAGPTVVLPVLVAYIHALRTLVPRGGPGVLSLTARFAEYAGWIAQESGDDTAALWWTDRAVEFAARAGDRELAVYADVRRGLVAMYRQDSIATIELSRRAVAASWCRPRIRGLASLREAQGLAIGGDYANCRRALDRAEVLLAAPSDDEPRIGTTTVPDPVGVVTGWCLYDLGRAKLARDILIREIARIPPAARRSRTRFGARLALAHASLGDADAACAQAESILDAAVGLDSATIRHDLRDLARTLNRRHPRSALPTLRQLAAVLHTPENADD